MMPRIEGRTYMLNINIHNLGISRGCLFVCVGGTEPSRCVGDFRSNELGLLYSFQWGHMLLLDACHNEPEREPKAWSDVAVGDIVEYTYEPHHGVVRAAWQGHAIVDCGHNRVFFADESTKLNLYAPPTLTPETAEVTDEPEQWLRIFMDTKGRLRTDNPSTMTMETPLFGSKFGASSNWGYKGLNTVYVAKLEKV